MAELLEKVNLPSHVPIVTHTNFRAGSGNALSLHGRWRLNPTLLVCDESVSALDVSVQAQVLNLLNDLKKDLGLTMLFISHDLSVVRYMSDRIAVMQAGKIVEIGDAEEVYYYPKEEYTQRLLEAIPKIKK